MGIKHLFPGKDDVDDYEEYIKKPDDPRILNRYADISNLGFDIKVDENTVFRKSTVSKTGMAKRKMTIKARLKSIKILDTVPEEEKKEHEEDEVEEKVAIRKEDTSTPTAVNKEGDD